MAKNKVSIIINADGSAAISGIGKVSSSMGDLKGKSATIGQSIKQHWLGLTAAVVSGYLAISKSFGFIKESIRLAGVQQDAETKLTAALGYRSQALLDQASALQQLTRYGDEEIIQSQALIAAFTKSEAATKTATKATLDLAAGAGMNLKDAANLVAKTLGSTTNALARYGISVEGAVGSTERLESFTRNVSKVFGGMAAADAGTYTGKVIQLKNAWGDAREEMGKAFTTNTFLVGVLNLAKQGIEDLTNYIKTHREEVMNMVKYGIMTAVESFIWFVKILDKVAASARWVANLSIRMSFAYKALREDVSAEDVLLLKEMLEANDKRGESWEELIAKLEAFRIKLANIKVGTAKDFKGTGTAASVLTQDDLDKLTSKEFTSRAELLRKIKAATLKVQMDLLKQRLTDLDIINQKEKQLQKDVLKGIQEQNQARIEGFFAVQRMMEESTGEAGTQGIATGLAGMAALEGGFDIYSQQLEQLRTFYDEKLLLYQQGEARLFEVFQAGRNYELYAQQVTDNQKLLAAKTNITLMQGVLSLANTLTQGKYKALFIAIRAMSAAQAVIAGHLAAAAALAPPPLGLGPVAGIPLAAKMKLLGYINAAAILAQTFTGPQGAGGTVGGGGNFASPYPGVTPAPDVVQEETKAPRVINVHVYGPYVGDTAKFARELVPDLQKAWEDNAS